MSARHVRPLRLVPPLLALAGCGAGSTGPGPGGDPPPILTELPRALSPAELRIVEGANAFTFDLARQATRALPPDSNAVLSPLSASMALGMALNGANGETWTAMRAALRLEGMEEADIDQGYRDLTALLRGLDARTEMLVASSMWADRRLALLPAFVDAGRSFFDAEVATLDFGSPEALAAINGWVNDATRDRIPKLLDHISNEEVLFLVNAIYFKGTWRTAFDPDDTRDGPFHAAHGRVMTVPLMTLKDELRYAATDDWQAVDLLYGNGAFAMTVLLPASGRTPAELLGELSPERWTELAGRFQERLVTLALPRFQVEYGRKLDEDLRALGMGIAFGAEADFSRIADVAPDRLYITRVEQKTFVEVNEAGTEAAAATAVGIGIISLPEVTAVRVDRPFVFAIRERLSGAVLFLGVINVVGE
jgi:serine protease inhibitor